VLQWLPACILAESQLRFYFAAVVAYSLHPGWFTAHDVLLRCSGGIACTPAGTEYMRHYFAAVVVQLATQAHSLYIMRGLLPVVVVQLAPRLVHSLCDTTAL
jgi:hypothetical protein